MSALPSLNAAGILDVADERDDFAVGLVDLIDERSGVAESSGEHGDLHTR